jgi:transposase InsO family protein
VKVHPAESAVLAAEMMTETFSIDGTPQVVHADRGTSMTSKTVAALLSDPEVTKSHSRPRVSNDNPYSEAWFKTLKFAPVFPERFSTSCDPKILATPDAAWINKPAEAQEDKPKLAAQTHAGLIHLDKFRGSVSLLCSSKFRWP